jgi:heme/copper-type cytochrome/quinol oxidase subunit 4
MDIQLFWVIVIILSVVLTIIAADIAKKKGCNYGIIILLGVIFTPM